MLRKTVTGGRWPLTIVVLVVGCTGCVFPKSFAGGVNDRSPTRSLSLAVSHTLTEPAQTTHPAVVPPWESLEQQGSKDLHASRVRRRTETVCVRRGHVQCEEVVSAGPN
jgi:hypothetical protein